MHAVKEIYGRKLRNILRESLNNATGFWKGLFFNGYMYKYNLGCVKQISI